jgi:hypothetical protein
MAFVFSAHKAPADMEATRECRVRCASQLHLVAQAKSSVSNVEEDYNPTFRKHELSWDLKLQPSMPL